MIRAVREEDVPAITDIYNSYVQESDATFDTVLWQVEEMVAKVRAISARYPYWVYELEGRIVGFCYAHPWKEKPAYRQTWETTVYLAPGVKGRGIGRRLMEKLVASCRLSGECHALIACITGGNSSSERLHSRMGFRQVSRFEQVGYKFGRWLDVVDYELVLSEPDSVSNGKESE